MNGVRRFLGAATATATPPEPVQSPPANTAPLVINSKGYPSWPPQPSSPVQQPVSPLSSPKTTPTAALFLRKDKQKPPLPPTPNEDDAGNSSIQSSRSSNVSSIMSPTRTQTSFTTSSPIRASLAGSSSPASPSSPRGPPNRLITRKSINPSESDHKRSSSQLNIRDELLISLLASDAVVDSREFEILGSEEVDDLKKEQQVLTSRLGAMTKKLRLETKIRDAAISLTRVNASHKKISKQTDEQLEAANRRVDAAQKELWRVSERLNEVQKRLLEHRAGVLSYSVRSMEKKMAPQVNGDGEDSGYDTPSHRGAPMSPTTSSMTGMSTSSRKPRFDGAHLFAGHADAVVPKRGRSPATVGEIIELEEKLKAATESLTAAGKKQGEMSRELSLLRLEKQEVETMMGMDLQSAEETINALEKELPRLESLETQLNGLIEEKSDWEKEREELATRAKEAERRLIDLEEQNGQALGIEGVLAEERESNRRKLEEKENDIAELRAQLERDRNNWEQEKAALEDEKMEDLARLQDEMDKLRETDVSALRTVQTELEQGVVSLRALMQTHGVSLFTGDSSLQGLLSAVGTHISTFSGKIENHSRAQAEWETLRRKLEDDVRNGLDKRESLARELEEARRERETVRKEVRSLEDQVKHQSDRFSQLRSPPPANVAIPIDYTGDAGKIVSVLQPIWAILPSPETRAAKFASQGQFRTGSGSPTTGRNLSSLSDLDVRSLKSLYDNRSVVPPSPNQAAFSVEAFASRVQALIADDRALIERLVRFAQAHDLLKKNAERAQKLAQDSNVALETYQKQVQILEERNMTLLTKHAAMQDEVQQLQDAVDRITAEKQEVEMHAAEQAETCRQLTEANNTLSARTLTLAEEAASAPEMIKRQLEAQLAECKASLELAQDEIDAMRTSEQSQRIALLDELNSMQTENGSLRAQLRAAKK